MKYAGERADRDMCAFRWAGGYDHLPARRDTLVRCHVLQR